MGRVWTTGAVIDGAWLGTRAAGSEKRGYGAHGQFIPRLMTSPRFAAWPSGLATAAGRSRLMPRIDGRTSRVPVESASPAPRALGLLDHRGRVVATSIER
jgi:hypothetical protein